MIKFHCFRQCMGKQRIFPANSRTKLSNHRNRWRTLQAVYSLSLLLGITLLTSIGTTTAAYSATYYISPSGNNSNFGGSSSKPWRTFSFAIPKLKPGDTLILKDGRYTVRNSGFPNINCASSSIQNGTSSKRITIKAQNERKAFLDGIGRYPTFQMYNCSYWNILGIRAKGKDDRAVSGAGGHVFKIYKSKHITLKRLLLTHNNRYANSHLLLIWRSNNILVEESEFYYYHRHAIANNSTNNSVYRRLYGNSRGYKNISGGYRSGFSSRGEVLVSIYPGSNNIVENSISEGGTNVVDIQATSTSKNNRFYGLISLKDYYGATLQARGSGSKRMPTDTYFENLVVVNPRYYGIYARGSKNTKVKNASVLGGASGYVADYEKNKRGDGLYSFFSTNALAYGIKKFGFSMKNQKQYSQKYPSSYNPSTDFSPNRNYFNERRDNPKLGNCKVFIPKTASVKKKGERGADIGANIVYRYSKGRRTSTLLWNSRTGAFPGGAKIKGVNDKAGSSLFDVHKRLNVNYNGCKLSQR